MTAAADRRGHLCPSDDRDGSADDNAATFLLTNIVPQAPRHNRKIWKNLEDYERLLATGGNEVYIIAEQLTGYDFLTNVAPDVQRIIEARVDGATN